MRTYEQPVVDFGCLPPAALERYARHYGISVNGHGRSGSLLQLVQEHFARSSVNETQALTAFEHANSKSRECIEDHPPTTTAKRRVHETPRKQKKARTLTYGDMISAALKQLPSNQGTLDEICDLIEKQYSKQLNHELESGDSLRGPQACRRSPLPPACPTRPYAASTTADDSHQVPPLRLHLASCSYAPPPLSLSPLLPLPGPRRITVWRASVRKIINLNYGMRFHRLTQEAEGSKAVFCLASGNRRGL